MRNAHVGAEIEVAVPHPPSHFVRHESAPLEDDRREAELEGHYGMGHFAWSTRMDTNLKAIFKLERYRLKQRAICNADMDCQNIIAVLPTGQLIAEVRPHYGII